MCIRTGSWCTCSWLHAQQHSESHGPSGAGKSIVWNVELSLKACFLIKAFVLTFLYIILIQRKCFFFIVCGFWEICAGILVLHENIKMWTSTKLKAHKRIGKLFSLPLQHGWLGTKIKRIIYEFNRKIIVLADSFQSRGSFRKIMVYSRIFEWVETLYL